MIWEDFQKKKALPGGGGWGEGGHNCSAERRAIAMISCSAWVAREAVAAQAGKKPLKGVQVDEELLKGLEIENEQDEDSWEEVTEEEQEADDVMEEVEDRRKVMKKRGGASTGMEDGMAELNMDAYDDEDDEKAFVTSVYGGKRPGGAFYRSSKEDPYMIDEEASSDSEDENDMVLRATDHMILAAKNEEDLSQLEVWVYEDFGDEGNLYVHQDIVLPAFALCVAAGDLDPRDTSPRKPMCAIGTFDPEIEIWDLTTVDSLQPAAVLGGYDDEGELGAADPPQPDGGKKKKKKKKKKKSKMPERRNLKEGSHSDSVLSLAWNWEYRNVLASGSADKTLKVWDLESLKCVNTLTHHEDKVQAVTWNPTESQVIASGGFDRAVYLSDLRSSGSGSVKWALRSDVEALIWDLHEPTSFLVSGEDGTVAKYDTRMGGGSDPVWSIAAHDKACCDLSLCASPRGRGLLATGSLDKSVKLWDLGVGGGEPELILSKKLKTGPVFTTTFTSEAKPLLAVGGAKGELLVWDVRSEESVVKKYPDL